MPASRAADGGYEKSLSDNPDYGYWAKMPYWTPAEAAALALGLCPEAMKRIDHAQAEATPPVVLEYLRLRKLVWRSRKLEELRSIHGYIDPHGYLRWSERHGVGVPSELASAVRASRESDAAASEASAKQLTSLPKPSEAKPLMTRERDTLLKLIAGMALAGYGYDPKAAKSPTVKEIWDDLALRGILLDQDTIRSKLKEAARLTSDAIDLPS